MNNRLRWAMVCLAAAASSQGCKSGDPESGVGGAGGTAGADGGMTGQGVTLTMDCVESGPECTPANTFQNVVAATNLYLCNYWDATQLFNVEFRQGTGGLGLLVEIAHFTGQGSYATNVDGTTNVTVTGPDVQVDAAGNPPSIPEHPCTIAVQSNLATIQIPADGDAALLDVTLDVTCAQLGGGAVCPTACDISPASFQLSIVGCLVSQ
jgi:hypothetical protein